MWLLAVFFIFAAFLLIAGLAANTPPYPYGRAPVNEWTEFKDGKPVRGVGRRGYWTNTVTHGEWPLHRCKECGEWVSDETGKHMVSMNLTEFLAANKSKEFPCPKK